jgi:ribulose-phosphate 3-epimerase
VKHKVVIAPSTLPADFGRLAEEAKRLEAAGADWIHVDVMDGLFVPNLTFGPKGVLALRKAVKIPLDVHLMIYNPFDHIEKYVEAGATGITFHFEATEDVLDTLQFIRKCNCLAGLAFCPETSVDMILPYLNEIDLLLMMTVHPGLGGQAFMEETLEKVRFAHEARKKLKAPYRIQVDGGITPKTAKSCLEAGADTFVSGSYLYDAPDMAHAIKELRNGQ